MKRVIVLLTLAVLAVAVIAAGCTDTSPETTPTPTAQPETTAAPATTTAPISQVPEPTDVIPDTYMVSVTAQKDPIYKTITVTFNGGKGQGNVLRLTATVTRSDGTTETKNMTRPSGSSILNGQTLEFAGTTAQDRVRVWATMDRPLGEDSATEFKIYDAVLPSK